jgi:hypothetical protein
LEAKGIIAEIDAEIARLQQARALLSGGTVKAKPGRPKGSASKPQRRKRVLSADARKRIADAQKRRWAERRKSASK